eukprot:comp8456_c0_seq1/m.3801 comp8456_c0_seq1/g.3801  ORF comp8456_c0_seq1/g.3801 comp8456_c0_seq1/m.3801 type:complete len:222 (-) comp8456_c0_seq1:355-1020(-)
MDPPQEVVQRPSFALRATLWLVSVIVWGCIKDKCEPTVCLDPFNQHPETMAAGECKATGVYCVFNNGGACGFGVFCGLCCFLLASAFLAAELFDSSLAHNQRLLAMVEVGAGALFSFLWFVCFCWLADAWRKEQHDWAVRIVNNSQAAIVFSFFAILLWAAAGYLGWMKFNGTTASYASFSNAGSAYAPYQGSDFAGTDSFNANRYSVANEEAYTPPSGAM